MDVDNERCFCEIETELEWRSRISLGDAQQLLRTWFQNQNNVFIEEYRLRRYARYLRRVGCRTEARKFSFETIGDYLNLCGLLGTDLQHSARDPTKCRSTCFSNVKTTNCNHLIFYPFQTKSYAIRGVNGANVSLLTSSFDDLLLENKWPPVFLLKRSLEMNESFLVVDSLEMAENVEMERSDNNLGGSIVRKICRNLILFSPTAPSQEYFCRLAIYSILDEYQQIRYELALECELTNSPAGRLCRSPFWTNFVSKLDLPFTCTKSQEVHRFSNACIFDHMDAMYCLVRSVTNSLDFTERTMIQLNIDWIPNDLGTPIISSSTTNAVNDDEENVQNDDEEDSALTDHEKATTSESILPNDNSLSYNTRLLSYVLPQEFVGSIENFTHFISYKIGTRLQEGTITVRPKINGVRLYASFDGRDKLYCDNGEVVRLNSAEPRKCFTTDMIYQLERFIDFEQRVHYVLTEVIVVRNSFSCQLNALSQSFSPSNMPYSYGEEQQWPYGLDGTGLSPHETLSMLQFWTLSACNSASSSQLVKRLIEIMRKRTKNYKTGQHDSNETTEKDTDLVDDEDDDAIELHPDPNEFSDLESEPDVLSESLTKSPTDSQSRRSLISDTVERSDTSEHSPTISLTGRAQHSTQNDTINKVCTVCRKLQREGLRNTPHTFSPTKGKNWDSQNFITVPMNDSFVLIKRIDAALRANQEHGLTVNKGISDPLQLIERSKQYYRYYILRLCDILFLSNKHELCFSMLTKHFPRTEVDQYVQMYKNCDSLKIDTRFPNIGGIASQFCEQPPIDGFLLYTPGLEESPFSDKNQSCCQSPQQCRPKARNTCTIDFIHRRNNHKHHNITAFKLKPYQSVELLLEISILNEARNIAQLDFCVRDSIVEQQQNLRSRMFLRGSNLSYDPITGETNLENVVWIKSDSQECDVHMDPRLTLIDHSVYEFVCYNERAFFLTNQRSDKLLPDSEDKINSIVYARKKLTNIF